MPRFFLILFIMSTIRVTTVQSKLHWEDVSANLSMFDQKLTGLKGQTDLIVLPEMFTTGFSMNAAKVAEKMDGRTVEWMAVQANRQQAVVTGSFIAEEEGAYFNRLIWMSPDGTYKVYDKRHLFTLAGEQEVYQAGSEKLEISYKGWRICPMICYDLRFPVWSRNTTDYDLLFYVANWPNTRSYHWRHLLIARAIENQSFVVGVNRTGKDEKGLHYSGDSAVIDYSGNILYQLSNQEGLATCSLDKEVLLQFRAKLNFLNDQDKFNIL